MNVPKLRFKCFQDEWKNIDLSKCFEYFSTNSLSRDSLSNEGVIKNVHYGDIHRKFNSIVDANDDIDTYIKDINYVNKNELLKENDLIFADASEDYEGIGKSIEIINVGNNNIVAGLHTILARETNKYFSPKFKGYYFNSPVIHNQIRVLANGFKVYGISKATINSINAKIPNLSEQEKISNTLYLLDKKIELQSKKVGALKLYKKGLFSKVKDLNCIEDIELKEIAKFENGKGHESLVSEDGTYILINSKFISTDGNVIKKCTEQLTPLIKNDIVMVMSDLPNGKALAKCFFIDEDNKYSLNQRICSLRINPNTNPKYIYYKINRNQYYLKFDDKVNQTNLKKDDVLGLILPIPDLETQNKVANIMSIIDKKILNENLKFINLIQLKKGLMQNMFV